MPKLSSLLFSDGDMSEWFSSCVLVLNRLPVGTNADDSVDDDDDNDEFEFVDDVNNPGVAPFSRGRNAAA